jgi:IS30 family transposase
MRYRQLTPKERYQIQTMLGLRYSPRFIALHLCRHKSTIWREIRRNRAKIYYCAERAARLTHQRRLEKGRRSRKIRGWLKRLVETKLRLSWSPEQISGRLRVERRIRISHETIYQHVIRDAKAKGTLRYCLRFGGYKHHRCKKSKVGELSRRRRKWIDQRPAEANLRSENGHWERDLVEGKRGSAALLTIVDRRSRFTRLRWIERSSSEVVAAQTASALAPYALVNKTVTNDNGHEFQQPKALETKLGVDVFFTEPSSPWQRGTVENTNGLVRQYFPKRTNLETYPRWAPRAIEETLNHRPRKTLRYRTPYEIFFGRKLSLLSGRLLHFGLEFTSIA